VHAIFTMFIRLTFLRFPSKIIERAYPIRAFALPAAVKRQNKTFGSSPFSPRPRSAHREKLDPACFAEIARVLLVRSIVPMLMYAKAAASDAVVFGIIERL
jgi:hypothetical protein